MAQTLKTYSPQEVTVTWGGFVEVTNFAEGSAIEVSRNADNSTQTVGMQGDVGLTYNADKTGQISFTIMQTGTTNQTLSLAQLTQDQTGELIRGDIVISDPSGSFLCFANNCHIMTPPQVSLGDGQNSKTWTFFVERLDFTDVPVGAVQGAGIAAQSAAAVEGLKGASDALNALLSQ